MDLTVSTCRIRSLRHPFDDDVLECYVPAGFALSEMLSSDGGYFVEVDGARVDDPFALVVSETAQEIIIVGRPAVVGGWTAFAYWASVTFGASLVVANIILYGLLALPYLLAIAALVSVATMDLPETPQTGPPKKLFSLTGSTNKSNPYGPVPVLYGKRRLFPAIAATPYTELVGQDQYLNMLFMVSLGDCAITVPKLGENLLTTYENVTLTQTTYPNTPTWKQIGEVFPGVDLVDPADSDTPLVSRTETSGTGATALSVDLSFGAGLVYTNSKGDKRAVKVHLVIEYKTVASSTWLNVRSRPWEVSTTGSSATSVLGYPAYGSDTGELFASDLYHSVRDYSSYDNEDNDTTTPLVSKSAPDADRTGYVTLTLSTGFMYSPYQHTVLRSDDSQVKGVWPLDYFNGGGPTRGLKTQWLMLTADAALYTIGIEVQVWVDERDTGFMVWERNPDPFRVGIKWVPQIPGQYDVRVTRVWLEQHAHFTSAHVLNPTAGQAEHAKYQDNMSFSVLRTYTNFDAVVTDPTQHPATYLTLRIRANDQLNGTLDDFSVLAERKVRAWNGTSWGAPAVSRSAAWAALDMLTNPAVNQKAIYDPADPLNPDTTVAKAMQAEQIDMASFIAFNDFCIANNFYYDEVIDYNSSVTAALGRAAGAAWSSINPSDGKFRAVIEQAYPAQQLFTPKNSWDFSAQKTFFDRPHAIKVDFDSEDTDYDQDTLIVYDDGYDDVTAAGGASGWTVGVGAFKGQANIILTGGSASFEVNSRVLIGSTPEPYTVGNWAPPILSFSGERLREAHSLGEAITKVAVTPARRFENIRLPGVTDPDNAWKHGRRLLAMGQLRPEVFTFKVGLEGLLVQRGNVATLQHDVSLIGIAAGRITAKSGSQITIDEPVLTVSGKSYEIRCRPSNAGTITLITRTATPTVWDNYNTVWTMTGDISAWALGDLVAIGEAGLVTRDIKILGVQPEKDLTATITAVDENIGIYHAHEQDIPDYDPGITQPVDPSRRTPAAPIGLRFTVHPLLGDSVDGGGRTYSVSVSYERGLATDTMSLGLQVRYRWSDGGTNNGGWVSFRRGTADGIVTFPITRDLIYEAQLRFLTSSGVTSPWSASLTVTTTIDPTPLEDIEDLTVTGVAGGYDVGINVSLLTNIGVDHFEVRTHTIDGNINLPTYRNVTDPTAKTVIVATPNSMAVFETLPVFIVNTASEARFFWARWVDVYGNASPWYPAGNGVAATALPGGGAAGPPGPSALVGVRPNKKNLTDSYTTALFIHGFDATGVAVASSGKIYHNGALINTGLLGTLRIYTAPITDGWIAFDTAQPGTPLFSKNGGDQTPPNPNAVFNPHLALIKRYRSVGGVPVFKYDTYDAGMTPFTMSNSVVIIGSYRGTSGGAGVQGASVLGNTLSPFSIPVERASEVEAGDLLANSITSLTPFASGIRPPLAQATAPSSPAIGDLWVDTDDHVLRRWTGVAWTAAVNAPVITGELVDTQIAAGAIKTLQLDAGAVTAAKIFANTITAGQMAVGAIGATEIAARAITASKMQITNQGFALNTNPQTDDLNAWSASYSVPTDYLSLYADFSIANPTDNVGTAAIHVAQSNPAITRKLFSPRCAVDPRRTYRVSCWARRTVPVSDPPTGANYTYLSVEFQTNAGAHIEGGTSDAVNWPSRGTHHYWGIWGAVLPLAWTRYEFVFGPDGTASMPTNAGFMLIGAIATYNSQSVSVTADFQDFRVEEVIPGSLIVDGAITAEKIAAYSITASKLQITNMGSALNTNPQTDDLHAWSTSLTDQGQWLSLTPGYSIVETTTAGKSGSAALQVAQPNATTAMSFTSQHVACDPTRTYRASVWVRRTNSGDTTARLRMLFYTGTGTNIISHTSATGWLAPLASGWHWGISDAVLPNTFTRYEIVFGPLDPLDSSVNSFPQLSIPLFMSIGAIISGTVGTLPTTAQFQDFRIEEVLPGVLIKDGTITAEKLEANLVLASKISTAASPAYRVEIEGAHAIPLFIGTSTKSVANAALAFDTSDNTLHIKGRLKASSTSVTDIVSTGGYPSALGGTVSGWGDVSGVTSGDTTLGPVEIVELIPIFHPNNSSAGGAYRRLQSMTQPVHLDWLVGAIRVASSGVSSARISVHRRYDNAGAWVEISWVTLSALQTNWQYQRITNTFYPPNIGWSSEINFRMVVQTVTGASDINASAHLEVTLPNLGTANYYS